MIKYVISVLYTIIFKYLIENIDYHLCKRTKTIDFNDFPHFNQRALIVSPNRYFEFQVYYIFEYLRLTVELICEMVFVPTLHWVWHTTYYTRYVFAVQTTGKF